MVGRVEEVGNADSVIHPVGNDPMHGRPIAIVRPDLDDVPNVDNQGVGGTFKGEPSAVCKDLQSWLIILQKDGDCARVGMMADTQVSSVAHKTVVVDDRVRAWGVVVESYEAGVLGKILIRHRVGVKGFDDGHHDVHRDPVQLTL